MSAIGTTLQHIRHLIRKQTNNPLSDRELLDRFARHRDQDAFAALVDRYGEIVRGVCRRALGHDQDAEDALQAVFLVLARKAGSLVQPDAVGPWLFGVARRVARNLKRATGARQRHESQARPVVSVDPSEALTWREVQGVLDEELERLPARYQAPLLLCYWHGRTQEEGARQLGWSVGAFKGRLDRGRQRLQRRLRQRGMAYPSVMGAALLAARGTEAAVPAALRQAVLHAAARCAGGEEVVGGGISSKAEALVEQAMRTPVRPVPWHSLGGLILALTIVLGVGLARQQLAEGTPEAAPPGPMVRTDQYGDPLPPGALARMGTVRLRHGEFVHLVAFAPDGKSVASAGADKTVRLWDALTGKEIRSFDGHASKVYSLAFAPDGKVLATSDDDRVRFWDVASGKQINAVVTGSACLMSLAPDGKSLATAGEDGKAVLWDIATGKKLQTFKHDYELRSVAFSPDGKSLAMAGEGGLRIWEVASGKELHAFEHICTGHPMAFAPDGKSLVVEGGDKLVHVWDTASGKELHTFNGNQGDVWSVAFAPDGKSVASTGSNGKVVVWNIATGKELHPFADREFQAFSVAFAPNGKFLAAAGCDRMVRLWDLATDKEIHAFTEHVGRVVEVSYTPDGKMMVSGGEDNTVRLWDVVTGKQIRAFTGRKCCTMSLAPDGKSLATGDKGAVRLWDLATGKQIRAFEGLQGWVYSVAFAPDGKMLASASEDMTVRLWDVASGKEIHTFTRPHGLHVEVAFAPDGKSLASAGKGGVRLWDVVRGKEIRAFKHQGEVESVVFAPDGKSLATTGRDDDGGPVRLWDVASGKEIRAFNRDQCVWSVAFAPDGKSLASASPQDNTVHLWDVTSGKELHAFVGHRGEVMSVVFAPDGQSLASASGDSTVLVWDKFSKPDQPTAALAPRDLPALWDQLTDDDGSRAWQAVSKLVDSPEQSVPYLRERVQPEALSSSRLKALLADLDSPEFAVREKAGEGLAQLGFLAEPALRDLLESKPTLDLRLRVEALLDKPLIWSEDRWRLWRVIQVLEGIGTRDAQAVLEKLAKGAPESRITQEAHASLKRLAKRPGS